MANAIIKLNDSTTAVNDLAALINSANKALFVILGNTPAHTKLANDAQPYADRWRFVVQVTVPANLQSVISTMKNSFNPIPANFSIKSLCFSINSK